MHTHFTHHHACSGVDVLLMNIHQLCFWRVANASGESWRWWDYAESFQSNCTMGSASYHADCAQRVFAEVGGPALAGGQGASRWADCIGLPSLNDTSVKHPVLEAEMEAQRGSETIGPVAILPTIRINDNQFRGTLDAPSVMAALCAGFPVDNEPDVCNQVI